MYVRVIPVAAKLTLPWKAISTEPAKVTLPDAGPAIVNEAHRASVTPASIVTVYAVALEAESKITVSRDVGALAPALPPEDVDHLVGLLQLPVPNTQYSVRGAGAAVLNTGAEAVPVLLAPA